MFCKRIKKDIPHGTFISTPARVMAILQLCLAFTVLTWQAGYPFMGELFDLKSKLIVYQYVMGVKNPSYSERFTSLSLDQKNEIFADYNALQKQYERPFSMKILDSLERLFFGFSPLKFMWIFFSIVIPILLLKKVPGALSTVWLLPFITFLYIISNRWYGTLSPPSKEADLYPTENTILSLYLQQPLNSSLAEQELQLKKGWELYLIKEWAHETPSLDKSVFKIQKEKGDFAFNLARLKFLKGNTSKPLSSPNQESYYILALYLFWNLSFAIVVWSALRHEINDNTGKITD